MPLAGNAHDSRAWRRCYVAALLFVRKGMGAQEAAPAESLPQSAILWGGGEAVLQRVGAGRWGATLLRFRDSSNPRPH
jgi:hypothetical protein